MFLVIQFVSCIDKLTNQNRKFFDTKCLYINLLAYLKCLKHKNIHLSYNPNRSFRLQGIKTLNTPPFTLTINSTKVASAFTMIFCNILVIVTASCSIQTGFDITRKRLNCRPKKNKHNLRSLFRYTFAHEWELDIIIWRL